MARKKKEPYPITEEYSERLFLDLLRQWLEDGHDPRVIRTDGKWRIEGVFGVAADLCGAMAKDEDLLNWARRCLKERKVRSYLT